jgi:hypothetical protein
MFDCIHNSGETKTAILTSRCKCNFICIEDKDKEKECNSYWPTPEVLKEQLERRDNDEH